MRALQAAASPGWVRKGTSREGSCGGRSETRTGVDEFSFDFPIFKPIERLPGDQKQVIAGGNLVLIITEHLAKPTLGAGALDCGTDGGGRGHDADTPQRRIGHRFMQRRRIWGVQGTPPKPKCKTAALHAAASFPNGPDIALAPQVLLGAETHGRTRN